MTALPKPDRPVSSTPHSGCELAYLPPYSPDFDPIEQAFSKVKGLLRGAGARTRESLIEALDRALETVSDRDAGGSSGTAATARWIIC